MRLVKAFSFFLLFLVACAALPQKYVEELPSKPKVDMLGQPAYCNVDADCTCGGIDTKTSKCFVGNKLYSSKYVDLTRDCPDFCTGIGGNLETKCVDHACKTVQRKQVACTEEAKLCPDGSAVGRVGPNCEFAPCPEEKKADLSDAHWQCEDGSWRENPEQCFENTCLAQDDCQLIGVKGICGPYMITAPKSMHKPPIFYDKKCGAERCNEMLPMCVPPDKMPQYKNVLCDGGRCVAVPAQPECERDGDCVKNACCHATGCVPKFAQPKCDGVMCTQECASGSLDCGGTCSCVENRCTGRRIQ